MKEYTYFISHSERDKNLAAIFYKFLEKVIGLPKEKIFCASISEQIPFGTDDYLQYIRDAINATKENNGKLIALITNSFKQSDFCKYEIGAAWILSIPIRPILFPPIAFNDETINRSPISKTQAVRIEKDDLSNSTYKVLMSLLSDGDKNGYTMEELKDIQNTTNEIVALLQQVKDTRIYFDMLKPDCGIYSAYGYAHTLNFERDYDEQLITLNLDFTKDSPPYAGYYVRPLIPRDWTQFVKNKFFIRFDAFASPGVEKVYIELKCQNYQIMDKAHRLYPNNWSTYSTYLGNLDPNNGWDNMKEICFVVKQDSMIAKTGYLRIKNLRLEREPLI